ncbi:MAG: GntR family transcriptional regulator [Confluentimicrobium sp.]|jgi:DNA-binding GntR family transcriptional regulator|uniref:GntR family transcriptional regulator n=1 Tax=Actibacterium sp. TaxID=1872125 RepID=UPI00050EBC34|nr:GntR family transcriptional regulator [Actibacterium sp.]KGB82662.1 transcriptional regulator [Rhodovulum sp. NI22]MBC56608.1 GntR family transcriptional regulator [Actibacterium sp.]MDY6859255.1 GntR family transcriptional regulator [Pseudomonadota bacterium]|tara:strand:- start:2269 stop:2937 length:669 start_codon:yes stop_codon:yes gene_type:complete
MASSRPKPKPAHRELHSTMIASQLENEIVSGRLKAGSKLDEQSLTQRFGVSRTPIREALHVLVARSLAERVPYRGVLVVDITRDRIEQMFEAMGEIEALCGRFAAERMTIGERGELEELHRRMNTMAADGDSEAYEAANTEFHGRIFASTHNEDLIELANNLRLKLAPFRRSQLRQAERMARSSEEHEAIVSALLDRDPKRAEKALRRHLVSAAREVLARMP